MFAIIGKWNNRVQSISATSAELTELENVYEVETAFEFVEPVVPDTYVYTEGTFILLSDYPLLNIDENWQNMYSDYKAARVAVYIAMMMKGGFNNLSEAEKIIASKWFVVGRTERNSVHTVDQQIENGLNYHQNSTRSRNARFDKCITEVYNRLDDDQIKEVMIAMDYNKTVDAYIKLGIEGTQEGNPEGLYDYILARAGTQWESTGLSVQAYTPVGMADCQELANRLMDILVNGNY